MSINRHAPFVYHWPEHGVWAFFRPTWDWRNQSGGTIECVVRPLRSEQINGRTVEWYDTKPVLRLAFVVEPRKLVSYKRCADAPSTLPEQVTPTEFDARLEGCYSAVYQDAVYRYESFEAPIVTLTTGPGTLPEGWESQLPYGYLISPVCAASAPCVMPEAYVWRLVVAEARRVVKTRSDLCLTDDYENVGHVSVGKVTADHKRSRRRPSRATPPSARRTRWPTTRTPPTASSAARPRWARPPAASASCGVRAAQGRRSGHTT